jgi:hypothetical protein
MRVYVYLTRRADVRGTNPDRGVDAWEFLRRRLIPAL